LVRQLGQFLTAFFVVSKEFTVAKMYDRKGKNGKNISVGEWENLPKADLARQGKVSGVKVETYTFKADLADALAKAQADANRRFGK